MHVSRGRQVSAGRSSVTVLLGAVLNAGLAFVVAGLVSNTLGAQRTGQFFQGVALFTVSATAVTLGADTAMVRTASRLQALGEVHRVWRTATYALFMAVSLGGLTGVVAWWWAPQIAAVLGETGHEQDLIPVIRALAPFLPAAPVLGILLGTSRGLGQIRPYTLIQNTLLPLTRVGAVGVLAVGTATLDGLALAWAAPLVLAALVAVVVLHRTRASLTSRPVAAQPGELRRFWGFAVPRGAASLVERGLEWIDVLLVIALAGPAAGGIYAIVKRVAGAGGLLESTMRIVTGPRISQAFAREDSQEVAALFRQGSRILLLLSGPLYVSLVVFAPQVLSLFGPEFTAGRVALTIICLAFLVETGCGMLQTVLLMGGRSHWQLQNKVVQLVVLAGGSVILVPRYGVVGAALAWAAGVAANLVLASRQVHSLCGVRPSLRTAVLPGSVVAFVFGLVPLLASWSLDRSVSSMIGILVVTGAVYLSVCFVLRRRLSIVDFWVRT